MPAPFPAFTPASSTLRLIEDVVHALDTGQPTEDAAGRLVALFARDVVVRRTALAAAVGLVATAFVFFRPPYVRPPRAPTDVIGA